MAKILVVDDDASIVQLLEHLLKTEGHEVFTARNGKEGLALAGRDKPDLIILDVMMPEMDGFTVSGILFQDPVMRKIPVLILTAKGGARPILELVPNVRLYMEKPFEPEMLRSNVRNLLSPEARPA
jgi:DNA-binding response OmpR family regulator